MTGNKNESPHQRQRDQMRDAVDRKIIDEVIKTCKIGRRVSKYAKARKNKYDRQ